MKKLSMISLYLTSQRSKRVLFAMVS